MQKPVGGLTGEVTITAFTARAGFERGEGWRFRTDRRASTEAPPPSFVYRRVAAMQTKLPVRTVLAACALTVVTSAHGLLTTASQDGQGKYRYNVATVPLLAEVLKLGFSLALLLRELRVARRHNAHKASVNVTVNAKSVSLYAFPSLIFLAHHAIAFPALQYLDPVRLAVTSPRPHGRRDLPFDAAFTRSIDSTRSQRRLRSRVPA